MHKTLLSSVLAIVITGCATTPKSDYKELNALPAGYEPVSIWNICRSGAVADQFSLRVFLDLDYVTSVDAGAINKARVQILGQDTTETLRIDAVRNNKEQTVFRLTRRPNHSRDLYLVIESKTTSGLPIPLPGMMAFATKGERSIRPVGREEFEKFCSDTSYKVFAR